MKLLMMRGSAASAAVFLLLTCCSEGFTPSPRLTSARAHPFVKSSVSREVILPDAGKSMATMNPSDSGMNPYDSKVDMDASDTKTMNDSIPNILGKAPKPIFVDMIQKTIGDFLSKPNMQFLAAILAMALVFMPLPSEAATSGGRMGGSYSRPSQSRSMPSRSSYGGGSGSYGRGFSQGYSTGYYSRPSVVVTPGIGFGYNPLVSPLSPFGGYYGSGVGGGAGVITYARRPNVFDLIFLGGLVFVVTSFLRSSSSGSSPFNQFESSVSSALGPGTSVVQLSIAMDVPNRDDPNSILSVLNRLAQTAKTDSRVGIQNLTSQVALELLRRRSSIVSASSSYQHYLDSTKAGRDYEAKAIKERSKFERETLSKYGGVDYGPRGGSLPKGGSVMDGQATMAVVTLVLAIDGDSTKIPTRINSIADVEEALRKIASDAKVDDCLQSVEILWTPEERTETLSRREVLADYPELRSI